MLVREINLHQPDSAGATIDVIYAKRQPIYAIYKADGRVTVHYADDQKIEANQRIMMAPLTCARGAINGLIDGWRTSSKQRVLAKAGRYQRSVADALAAALERDPNALSILQMIKKDIIDERTSWARFEYLTVASFAAAICVALVCFITSPWFDRTIYTFPASVWQLWVSAGSGTVGAFFSIAIAIRSRTVLTDLHFRDNAADAILRVVIGSIAASVAVCLIDLKAVVIAIGSADTLTDPEKMTLYYLFIAFVAGFSERLVPDLLDKADARFTQASEVSSGAGGPGAAEAAPGVAGAALGIPVAPPTAVVAASVAGASMPDPLEDCLCETGVLIHDHDVTADHELPAATGGVEVSGRGDGRPAEPAQTRQETGNRTVQHQEGI
jgi:hypothetical protein